jgi:S1-C subfamily serine protease
LGEAAVIFSPAISWFGDAVKLTFGWSVGAVLVGGLLSGGCGMPAAESAFEADFSCPSATAESTAFNRYRVHGCGRTASYVCVGAGLAQTCVLQTAEENEPSAPEPTVTVTKPRVASRVEVDHSTKKAVMRLELVLDRRAMLRLTALPDERDDMVQLKLVRKGSDECKLDFMVNGQVLAMPKTVSEQDAKTVSHRVQIGRDLIREFEVAEKISIRACDERWGLEPEHVARVRQFMDRFQEEMAWKAPPRNGGSGGMVAPSGGWPAWTAPSTAFPSAAKGAVLDPPALFKKLSASVFKLEATLADGTSQGSAVAVTPTELVTNCHVIRGAVKLTLKQGEQTWPARVNRADPATDRCTVTVDGATFTPVAGVRDYDSIEVGEAAYTLGSPVGLELTLSSGLISGRREEDGHKYVQTTAPISPGSSGGGLFDARGNLIGVTTLVLVGREHLNQSLNFAIPVDSFGRGP